MYRDTTMFMCALLVLAVSCIGHTQESAATLKLYVFDCGMLRLDTLDGFSIANDETDIRVLSVPCYVVEHPEGRLLWDGGLPSTTAKTQGWQGKGMQSRLDRTLADQLRDIGLDMGSFAFMAFSHMHFDHVGVANEVEGATLIIQKAEYEAAFADPVVTPGFEPALYSKLNDAKRVEIEGDRDVFGDGRVRIVSTPGHTPGHQVLYIELEKTGPVVLSGDLYHFALSREKRRVPSFNVDVEQTLKSMDRVDALLEETGAKLWIEHELAWFEQLNKSPSYYD